MEMINASSEPRARRPRPAVVTLTEAAAAQIRHLVTQSKTPCVGIRVALKQAGCAGQEYVVSYAETAGILDEVVEDKGASVVVDAKAILYLIGTEIDYEVTPLASRFVFRNPNQTDACGCGDSVTLKAASEF